MKSTKVVTFPGPIDPGKRIEAIDMVRGFALFGVLLVNMYNFGAASPLWTGLENELFFSLKRAFFETKSWRLFSFLFGLGVSMQWFRLKVSGRSWVLLYLRRMIILFLFGAGHMLFYDGDILMLYAELGLILLLFWKLPSRLLLIIAIGLLAVFPISRTIEAIEISSHTDNSQVTLNVEELEARRNELLRTHPYSVGSIGEVMAFNAKFIPPNPVRGPLGPESNLAFFAMFLIGLYAGKSRLFENIEAHLSVFKLVLKWGLVVGFIGITTERILALGWGYEVFGDFRNSWPIELMGSLAFTYGSTALAIGYASIIVLVSRNYRWRRFVSLFGPVGRLALTVYLTQSLIFTTMFYGYGFGLLEQMGPFAVTIAAIFIFSLQVVVCSWWVRRYRFGPVEWLWRALTYLRLPSMKLGERL